MITIDSSVWIQIVSFLLLWFLLNKLLFKPYLSLLQEREHKTEGANVETSQLAAEADQLKAEYEKAIATATAEAQTIKETIRSEAARAREELLSQARAEAAQHLQTARDTIQQELARGQQQAVVAAETIARAMAEKILGRRVS